MWPIAMLRAALKALEKPPAFARGLKALALAQASSVVAQAAMSLRVLT